MEGMEELVCSGWRGIKKGRVRGGGSEELGSKKWRGGFAEKSRGIECVGVIMKRTPKVAVVLRGNKRDQVHSSGSSG